MEVRIVMKSILRYPGGKSKKGIQDKILAYAPADIKEYREPFVGGGGIFFALDGRIWPKPPVRWINDKNEDLVAVYEALRDRVDEFIAKCREISPPQENEPTVYPKDGSSGKKYNARLKAKFDELVQNRGRDRALSYFFINRTVWAGRVNYEIESRLYFSNPDGWNIIETDRLANAGNLLTGVKITTGDYAPLLSESGESVWIYCDPPYVKDTIGAKASKLYQNSFTYDDHKRLAKCITESPHRICLSYDDDEKGIVRELYAGSQFHIFDAAWTYCGTASANGEKKMIGKELIITNYPPLIEPMCKIQRYVDMFDEGTAYA